MVEAACERGARWGGARMRNRASPSDFHPYPPHTAEVKDVLVADAKNKLAELQKQAREREG